MKGSQKMDDKVAEIVIKAFLDDGYSLAREIGGFRLTITEDTVKYWNTGRRLVVERATKSIEKLLDQILEAHSTVPPR